MIQPVYTHAFSLPPLRREEALRYAGVKTPTPELSVLLEDAWKEAEPLLSGKVCWQEFPMMTDGDRIDLGFIKLRSDSLESHFSGCERVMVFAATLGLPLDRLIARYSPLSPARALMLQAIGTERVEALCNVFCEEIRKEAESSGLCTTSRFSPGYGDLPLSLQQDIFRVLDCPRRIGLSLNESLLMSPSKSVTAMIGIGQRLSCQPSIGCEGCGKNDCIHRRTL